MVPRRIVRLAIVDAVGRVHAHLAPPGLEDQPTRASALRILDVRPAEDVTKECARCGSIVGINQGVDAGNHQTELLKSPKILLFLSISRSSHWRSKSGHCPSLGVRWHFRQADSRARHGAAGWCASNMGRSSQHRITGGIKGNRRKKTLERCTPIFDSQLKTKRPSRRLLGRYRRKR